MTKAMTNREEMLSAKWKDEGGGYFSIVGQRDTGIISGPLAYVAIPETHPAIGKHYDEFDVDVNGGLTFASENVFGWDYMHAYNTWDIQGDIRNALAFFREFATTSATTPEVTVDA